jgi:hypothetical protein
LLPEADLPALHAQTRKGRDDLATGGPLAARSAAGYVALIEDAGRG